MNVYVVDPVLSWKNLSDYDLCSGRFLPVWGQRRLHARPSIHCPWCATCNPSGERSGRVTSGWALQRRNGFSAQKVNCEYRWSSLSALSFSLRYWCPYEHVSSSRDGSEHPLPQFFELWWVWSKGSVNNESQNGAELRLLLSMTSVM